MALTRATGYARRSTPGCGDVPGWADSRKNGLIGAAGRFTLLVDRLEPTIRYVSVEGPVARTTPATVEELRRLSARCLPAEKVDGYVDFAWENHGEQVVVHMRPERWVSSDLGHV